jgi:hypothetical protein
LLNNVPILVELDVLLVARETVVQRVLMVLEDQRAMQKIVSHLVKQELATTTFKIVFRHHCRPLWFIEPMDDLVANVFETHKALKIQGDGLLNGICFIFLLICVEMLDNSHTPGDGALPCTNMPHNLKHLAWNPGSLHSVAVKSGRTFLTKSGYACASVHWTQNFP